MGSLEKKILLVEDEPIIALSEQHILKKYGFESVIADSAEKAINEIEKSDDIDLVLMDIDLGSGMDGTEAAKIILEKRDLPIIFLSSHTEREVVEKTEGITSYGYIVKNTGETVLIASIKMAFRLFAAKSREDESLHFLERVIEYSPFCMWVSDEKGTIIKTNRALRKTLGIINEQIVGIYNVFNDNNLEAQNLLHNVKKVFSEKVPVEFCMKWEGPNSGHEFLMHLKELQIDVCLIPIVDQNNNLKNVVSQWVDNTKYVERENELLGIIENLKS